VFPESGLDTFGEHFFWGEEGTNIEKEKGNSRRAQETFESFLGNSWALGALLELPVDLFRAFWGVSLAFLGTSGDSLRESFVVLGRSWPI